MKLSDATRLRFNGQDAVRAVLNGQEVWSAVTATTYAGVVLADSPKAYWRLGDAAAPFTDQVGTAHLTAFGGPGPGEFGALAHDADTAVRFHGAGDYAEYDVADWSGPFTLEMWVKPWSSGQANHTGIFASAAATGGTTFQVEFDGTNGYTFSASGVSASFGSSSAEEGVYAHLVVAAGTGGAQLYLNGAPVGSKVASFTAGTFGKYRLATNRNTNTFANVILDEVAVYDHALSAAQVAAHYAAAH